MNKFSNGLKTFGNGVTKVASSPITMVGVSLATAGLGYLAQKEAAKAAETNLKLFVAQAMSGDLLKKEKAEVEVYTEEEYEKLKKECNKKED